MGGRRGRQGEKEWIGKGEWKEKGGDGRGTDEVEGVWREGTGDKGEVKMCVKNSNLSLMGKHSCVSQPVTGGLSC